MTEEKKVKKDLASVQKKHKKVFKKELEIIPLAKKAGMQTFKVVTGFAVFTLSTATGIQNTETIKNILENILALWPKKNSKIETFLLRPKQKIKSFPKPIIKRIKK